MIWGFASAALITPGQVDQHLLVLAAACSIASGALAVFGAYLPAFYALLFPFAVPYAIAAAVGISRASVYRLLAEARGQQVAA